MSDYALYQFEDIREDQEAAIEQQRANGFLPPESCRCTYCGGSGYDYTRRTTWCNACGGAGTNELERNSREHNAWINSHE